MGVNSVWVGVNSVCVNSTCMCGCEQCVFVCVNQKVCVREQCVGVNNVWV